MVDIQKIYVPHEMRAAALRAAAWKVIINEQIDAALKAALQWLSENPIVPTLTEVAFWADGLSREIRKEHPSIVAQGFAVEWQRRMFLAPPNPKISNAAQSVIQKTWGCTFSRSDADAIINAVNMLVDPLIGKDEPIQDLMSKYTDNENHADTLVKAMAKGHNADVREAYRRGKEQAK